MRTTKNDTASDLRFEIDDVIFSGFRTLAKDMDVPVSSHFAIRIHTYIYSRYVHLPPLHMITPVVQVHLLVNR